MNKYYMKMNSDGLGAVYVRMITDHASINDAEFVGQIVLYALGINAGCTGFTLDKDGIFHLYWTYFGDENRAEYHHGYTRDEIVFALLNSVVKTSIEVGRNDD